MPSPKLANTCFSVEKADWPTQGTPSPPIWVKPMVLLSIHTVIKWQPIPAMAREPSGTRVEVLCGQPEQNQGMRSANAPLLVSSSMARSLASSTAKWLSMRARTLSGNAMWRKRLAMARATMDGLRSALARSNVLALGLACDHSPPVVLPSASSNLPNTVGRTSERQLYNSSLSWYSITWRFSSTTKISRKPVANSRVVCASSGHTTATLCTRIPSSRHIASSSPKSDSAWRVSL